MVWIEAGMRRRLITATAAALLFAAALAAQDQNTARQALIARAKSLELDKLYVPLPGDPLEHHAAGYAKIMCSGAFITGARPAFAAENVGYFTAPYESAGQARKPVIDRANRSVYVTVPNGTGGWRNSGSQGCVALPIGKTEPDFTPVVVKSGLPDPAT